ncbi:MAG: toll/interleukin-1 receptor domain-containing protein [Clostridiales bacterium]|nr:toll/interleukin-1 receptor domain-containing protein [Clostridiales bacterium]
MTNIFISYSTKNQNIADEIYRVAREKYGLSCWLAPSETGIKPGELYPEAIINGIEKSEVVVFIDSADSVQSPFVFRELERSIHFNKCIIRFTIEEYSTEKIEHARKVIDFFTCVEQHINASSNPFNCISVLCEAVSELMGKKSTIFSRQATLEKNICKYINSRSLSDESWFGAISSQYFLIEIAWMLGLTSREDYYELEEKFYAHSCKLAHGGKIIPAPMQILVVPSENAMLIKNMQEEDDSGAIYPDRLRAKYINTKEKQDLIFFNYYYSLMVGIIDRLCETEPNNKINQAIRAVTVRQLLFEKKSQDDAGGGLYHYRLPWITARALISLSRYNKKEIWDTICEITSSTREYIPPFEDVKREFLHSIIDRMEPEGYWRSGAGNWVTQWESTGLCLEAIFVNNATGEYNREIRTIFKYLFNEEIKSKWLRCEGFDSANNSNNTLSNIILASVCFRIIKQNIVEGYKKEFVEILDLFQECYLALSKATQDNVQQQCTLPQCLYYILVAIKEN